MARGESTKHSSLKALALAWARAQGMLIAAPEVSFPHRRFRVDVAACCPIRKAPSRMPATTITSVLKAAAVFECKQVRSDLIRDNKRRAHFTERLRTLESRRINLESLLRVHLPHLANGESLLPEFDSYRLREFRHEGYRKLIKAISTGKRALIDGTKFDRLMSYHIANLHYLVVEEGVLEPHEVPTGWGLLVRTAEKLQLVSRPTWHDIALDMQLIFIQRIAAKKTPVLNAADSVIELATDNRLPAKRG